MSIKVKINNDWVDTNIKAVRGVNHVNSEDVYTKEETEKKFATKTEVLTQINNSITKENIENTIEAWLEEDNESTNGEVYTKTESDTLFSGKVSKSDIVQSTGTSTTAVMSQKAVSDALSNVYTKAESDARYLRGDWELISEVSEYDTSKNKITVAENCDGYKELAVRRTNSNDINNTNVYLQISGVNVSMQILSSNTKDAVWHIVQDGNNLSVKFLTYNFVNTGDIFTYPTSRYNYRINCKIGGKVELNFYSLTTLHDGENIKVYGKR